MVFALGCALSVAVLLALDLVTEQATRETDVQLEGHRPGRADQGLPAPRTVPATDQLAI